MRFAMFCVIAALAFPIPGHAEDWPLRIVVGAASREFRTSQLLARPDLATIEVPADPDYHRPRSYRAVKLLDLMAGMRRDGFDTLEAKASDGFVAQLPMDLLARAEAGGAEPWIAVEDPADPWPNLPGKDFSPGHYYLIWQHPERSSVVPEQWPYALLSLTASESPQGRWPQLRVPAELPAAAPARHGEQVFVAQCLPCHKLNSGGESVTGPDLARPMSPTAYFTPAGLRALIRNPKAVRTWPAQAMPGFAPEVLPDADLDDLIQYLREQELARK